jgi:peptide/nickel transport system ATP-binding protein
MSVLSVQELNVQFNDRHARGETVSNLSFSMEPGEIMGVVGESGSGKSTVMQAVMGLLSTRAEIRCKKMTLGQIDITPPSCLDKKSWKDYEKKMKLIRGNKISMVFQNPLTYLNPTVKIGRQITEVIRVHHPNCSRTKAREKAKELLDMVGIRTPSERLSQYPFELSGGMQQRVAIAIALAGEPEVLIADEPTTALDVTVQKQILQLLNRIAAETKTAILFVSHDLGVIASICSRVMVMHNGQVVETGTVEEIFYEPQNSYTKELLVNASRLQVLSQVKEKSEPLLQVKHVSRQYPGSWNKKAQKGKEAVRDVSFQLYKGETYGLVGESGCGKTTLAELITGVHRASSGEILFNGKMHTEMNREIQMVFQDPYVSLNPKMTILETLEEPLLLNTNLSAEDRKCRVREILNMVGLSFVDAEKLPRAFSGGQRQRIGIARALILEPELIVCDEPVSALDVSIQEQILSLLENIQKDQQLSYLFISHDLNVVKRISQRMGIMYAGSIVESGDTHSIYKDPWHPFTKTMLSSILTPDPLSARKRRKMSAIEEEKEEKTTDSRCPFLSRCGYAMKCCKIQKPGIYCFEGREVACFLYSREHTGPRSDTYKMTSQI